MAGNLLAAALARTSFSDALGEQALLRAMFAFENALAQSEATAGVIPAAAAAVIATACADTRLDAADLAAEGRLAGSLAIAFVRKLTEQVRKADAGAASFVHYGSTSQDVLDSAMMVCVLPCVAETERVLATAIAQLAAQARRHAAVVMLGRTMLQPATPITAGLKIARWAAALERCRARLSGAARRALCVQLGGPVGTLDALGEKRSEVRREVARHLGLSDARSWHSHRDELLAFAAEVTILVVTIGKIARDVALLSQAEVGEMLEAAPKKGVGTSSAMPHKRNPVACLQAVAAASRAPGLLATLLSGAAQEHERSLGGWQAELATLPDLLATLGGALDALERIAAGLVVDADRMQRNVEALQGLVFSERLSRRLMQTMDRASAMSLVDDWCALAVGERRHLKDVAEAALSTALEDVFSLQAIVSDLAPVLEEELAGL